MWCLTGLEPGEGLPVRYDAQRAGLEDDWECADRYACAVRMRDNELDDGPAGPECVIVTATDAQGDPLL